MPIVFVHKIRSKSSFASSANPFDVMGIPRDSCADVVRNTFLQLAMRYHPDTSGKDTADQFQRIRAAFDKITKAGGKKKEKQDVVDGGSLQCLVRRTHGPSHGCRNPKRSYDCV